MDTGRLEILKVDLNRQIEIIQGIYDKIQQRSQDYQNNEERMESLAYQLHNLYCAFEDLMIIVANNFENQIYESMDWHIRLLNRMTEKITNIRPPLFSRENSPLLDELRSFRHWFRHAYSHQVEQEKLGMVLRKALKLKEIYKNDIQRFIDSLS
jgi:hypothetical protein